MHSFSVTSAAVVADRLIVDRAVYHHSQCFFNPDKLCHGLGGMLAVHAAASPTPMPSPMCTPTPTRTPTPTDYYYYYYYY